MSLFTMQHKWYALPTKMACKLRCKLRVKFPSFAVFLAANEASVPVSLSFGLHSCASTLNSIVAGDGNLVTLGV